MVHVTKKGDIHDEFPAGVLVTNGLGGDFSTWIAAQFHLFPGVEVEVIVRAGGSTRRPRYYPPPRERDERYDDDEEPWKPREDEEHEVIIKIRIGQREIQRHYFVHTRTQTVVIQLINMVNVTMERVSINVGKLIKSSKSAVVAIKNFGRKNK